MAFYDGWAASYMSTSPTGTTPLAGFTRLSVGEGRTRPSAPLPPAQTTRTWFRRNPPLPKVKWSHRNNINLQQSAILFGMNYVAQNRERFMENFYWKSRRSIEKATKEGPAAWVIPANDPRPVECAELMNLLRLQGVEIHRTTSETEKPIKLSGWKLPNSNGSAIQPHGRHDARHAVL